LRFYVSYHISISRNNAIRSCIMHACSHRDLGRSNLGHMRDLDGDIGFYDVTRLPKEIERFRFRNRAASTCERRPVRVAAVRVTRSRVAILRELAYPRGRAGSAVNSRKESLTLQPRPCPAPVSSDCKGQLAIASGRGRRRWRRKGRKRGRKRGRERWRDRSKFGGGGVHITTEQIGENVCECSFKCVREHVAGQDW
jgi:hypothetical protein